MMDVRDVSPEAAARAMASLVRRDPRGMLTEGEVLESCRAGKCVRVKGESGSAIVVLLQANGVLWVEAAQADGATEGMSEEIDELLCKSGAKAIAFMTERRGLVRRAERRGYRVAGYVMKKEL
jgi:hypothetical protein